MAWPRPAEKPGSGMWLGYVSPTVLTSTLLALVPDTEDSFLLPALPLQTLLRMLKVTHNLKEKCLCLAQRRVHSKLRDNDLVTDILSLFFSRPQVGGSFFLDDACSV